MRLGADGEALEAAAGDGLGGGAMDIESEEDKVNKGISGPELTAAAFGVVCGEGKVTESSDVVMMGGETAACLSPPTIDSAELDDPEEEAAAETDPFRRGGGGRAVEGGCWMEG